MSRAHALLLVPVLTLTACTAGTDDTARGSTAPASATASPSAGQTVQLARPSGVQVLGGPAGKQYCGGYGDIAAARPGGAPAPGVPDPATLDPAEPGRGPSRGE